MSSYTKSPQALNKNTISTNVLRAEYAVRGSIVIRANQLEAMLNNPNEANKLPFKSMYMCNIGNPQALGQLPMTFMRQTLACCLYPALIKTGIMPKDVCERAQLILGQKGTVGAYTHSQGFEYIRKSVAKFIEQRDGFKSNPNDIFLTDGASPGVKAALQICISSKSDGIMIPIPQYPLYSASIAFLGGSEIGYYLDENKGWSIEIDEIERSYSEAITKGIKPRAFCVINPGNPTGQVLSYENMTEIIKFCRKNSLLLMADEVYQENIYRENGKFFSFKKVLKEMGPEFDKQELISFHSISKGMLGECGIRGGFMELINIDNFAREQFYKIVSVNLCSNITGQIAVELMVNPPVEGSPSFELYKKEMNDRFTSLQRRAKNVSIAFSKIEGIECQPIEGAMYAFPLIKLPDNAVKEAEVKGMPADTMYCMELLENTGICVVPGSGFRQKDKTFHFRTTILPQEKDLDDVITLFTNFHRGFLDRYKNTNIRQ